VPLRSTDTPAPIDDWTDTELDFKTLTIEKLRSILDRDGPYYPTVEGSTNAYRDGYIKEPPKKPRASYIFFQCSMRSYFQKKNPGAPQSELMSILGHQWQSMSEEERAPFLQLANEESKQHEKEKALKERAQRPTEVWQPIRRCHMVLDRLAADSFADIFLEPVNPDEFPDYEDLIDTAMDLGTVRTKLAAKKYQAPEQFARDMRKIWNNCKIYNQHGSAIWHVADYMSKQFERLYHAWVLEFRERYLRWSDPRARPWEHTCRIHDGTCGTTDEQMVLCDHCDGMYGIKCLTPSLKKIPKKAWHCTDCKPKLKSAKGLRMLSAVAENAARKRAELGDLPKKKVKQVMYLVKWAGLGYEHCTWETREDVNDDALLGVYHRLNSTFPGEPDLPEEVLEKYLGDTKHLNIENAGGTSCVPVLRSQLYAQSRAFQFSKFGMEFPDGLGSECGPRSKAALVCHPVCSNEHPREVVECVNDLVSRVSRKEPANRIRGNTSLPPPMTGEYDAIVPITSKGLMMNVGEIHGSVAFLGYRQFPGGTRGPAEIANLIRSVGDKIIAVDGGSTVGKSFKEVIMMLRESGKNKFAFMRFLENKYAVCENDLASVGTKGKYAIEELQKKFTTDRQRMLVRRKLVEDEVDDAAVNEREQVDRGQKDSDDESAAGSEGEFQPESDDEDLIVTGTAKEVSPSAKAKPSAATAVPPEGEKVPGLTPDIVLKEEEKNSNEVQEVEASPRQVDLFLENAEPQRDPGILYPQETTRSLAYRLLGTDVGYTSDEGGDDDCAFYLDGVDETFTNMNELADIAAAKNLESKGKTGKEDVVSTTIPAYQNEFSTKGDRGKLATAVALTSQQPCPDDFDHFPYPSSKEIEANKKLEEARLLAIESTSPSKSAKRSTVKVEQVSIATNEPVHVWANVEAIAATLQLPIIQLKQVLLEDYDEDIGDELGGFKWRYALAGAKVTAGNDSNSRGGGGKKAKAAWLEFRDKLYDPNVPYNYKNGNRLRDYQVDGVNWLASTWYKRQGCILADEMGLGKTVQIVCYIEHLFRVEKIKRPFLVVVPLSTVEHWRREFEGWTDMVCCVYHDRQRVWRDVMREYEWYYEDRPHTAEFLKFDVLVTTYDTLIGDFDVIGQIPFRVSVVDEAHRLRNQKGKLLECMREISAKGTMQYGFQSRVLMSGTPLQNDLTELWTLLNFIEPFRFPDLAHFQLNFGNMANREQVEALQKMISPCMLRRVKEDVAKDIPSKEETLIDVELTAIQKQYYRAIFEHNHAFLSMGSTRQTAPKLMNIQMELRKVCNHPFLIDGVEHKETERQFKEFSDKGAFEGKTPEMQQYMLNEHGYVMNSGKMVLLDKLLPKLRQEGHKILIFSQMVRMLDLISEYCDFREFRYERLDGRVRGTERQKAIDRFEREEDSFLFLLSTRAGGVGINLTAAGKCRRFIYLFCHVSLLTNLSPCVSITRCLYYLRQRLEPSK
jgi:superfamily II DNA or RNA helicase